MDEICQKTLPVAPWAVPAMARLPGVQPLDMADWLQVDDAFAAQMRARDTLIAARRDAVYRALDGVSDAAVELLALILDHLGPGYVRDGDTVTRPDGVAVDLGGDDPLVTAARLVQEDLCLLQAGPGGEHVLTGAVLCFPASWTLAEKLGRPLTAIHSPVDSYTTDMAARVQRLFDAIRPGRPLWRQNALRYADPTLFHPRSEAAPRDDTARETPYLRSERQSLIRLPTSGAVAFTIHTYVLRIDTLPPEQRIGLDGLEAAT
jgi:hypothetical protein